MRGGKDRKLEASKTFLARRTQKLENRGRFGELVLCKWMIVRGIVTFLTEFKTIPLNECY